jgi:hypothetical protein
VRNNKTSRTLMRTTHKPACEVGTTVARHSLVSARRAKAKPGYVVPLSVSWIERAYRATS